MRTKRAVSAWLIALLVLGVFVPTASGAQTGTTYTVQAGDTLANIAATYGTSVAALMQANGLSSADVVWVGQTLIIPVQVGSSGSPSAGSGNAASSYTVQVGDTIASIAAQLGVSSTALANANGLTNPDLLWVGQRLLVPGTTIGTSVLAPPPQPAVTAGGYYTVQPGDTLRSIAAQFGTTTAALIEANNLTNADLLFLGQRLVLPGSAAAPASSSAPAPTAPPAPPTAAPSTTTGSGRYVVQPGDTLNSIAQSLNISTEALARANNLENADILTVGQALVVPGAAATAVPDAGGPAPAATGQPLALATLPVITNPIPASTPGAVASATTTTPTSAPGPDAAYVVKPGDTLNTVAQALGVTTDALARANNLTNADLLAVGQQLIVPGANAPAPVATVITPTVTPAATAAAAGAEQQQSPPGQVRHTVKSGETLGTIAAKYGMSAAALARVNRISSPDLVSVGMTLLIPSPAWTAPDFSGPPSRFVVSISQQRCWLYQGNRTVADWPCSTGQAGTDTHAGSYKIQSKMDKAFGSTWNIWMPYWLGIYWAGASENGIHGIPYSAADSNWHLWEGWVGTPVTYGCVLLDNVHAKQLYDVAYIGMPVVIQP
ncbi:MAG TPA: LysM peptidoglycan-binding domain-containing protein [Anaerolineae bacterium]